MWNIVNSLDPPFTSRYVIVIGSNQVLEWVQRQVSDYEKEFKDRSTSVEFELDVSGQPGVTVYLVGFNRKVEVVYHYFIPEEIIQDIDRPAKN